MSKRKKELEEGIPKKERFALNGDVLLNEQALYRAAESRANQFNLRCLAIMAGFVILCEILNNVGIFKLNQGVLHVCSAVELVVFLAPILIWFIHDRVSGRIPSITEWDGFKYLIVITVYIGICLYGVVLTFHTVILLALPPIFAAQYSDQKRLLRLSLICGVLTVLIVVYLGHFYGLIDRNQLHDLVVRNGQVVSYSHMEHDAHRMLELFLHYALPRILAVIAINILVSGIARRNGEMLSRQAALAEQARVEMTTKNEIQSRVIEDLSSLIETRDLDTGKHVSRTKKYVSQLLAMMKGDPAFAGEISDELAEEITMAAPLHDIGKICISDTILLKPGRLTPEEFEIVKRHSDKGGQMIRNIFSNMEDPKFLGVAEDIARYHHEQWDGSGYPDGLAGKEIPLAARIMAVADVYDALISDRVYKKALPEEDALQIIYSEAGSHFDPEIIRVLKENKGKALQV